MPQKNGEYLAGFIDLGTNSVRLLIVAFSNNGLYRVVLAHKEMVRLGEGAYLRERLSEEAMQRTLSALKLMGQTCRDLGVTEITAVATAATRDAENAAEFIARAEQESGIHLMVIPGKEEARLIYRGASSGLPIGDKNTLFIDIGGGSTEIVLGNADDCFFLESLSCGCVRYTNRFFEPEDHSPVSLKKYKKICSQVREHALHTLDFLKQKKIDIAVGSSGTIENLAEIALRRKNPALRLNTLPLEDRKLNYNDLQDISSWLCSLSLEERRMVPGINPKRADVIVAGTAIIQTLMEELNLPEVWISDRGLQHGLLMDYLRSERFGMENSKMSVRELSVLQLLKRSGVQETHAMHVARLALSIFDDAQRMGLIPVENGERELLYYAGILHDIGIMLSLNRHHAHSYYFIKNSELLGFYTREIDIIASSAYFHGKKALRSAEGVTLSPELLSLARRHGAILRFCEALDRTHRGLIQSAALLPPDKDKKRFHLILTALQQSDCSVELSAARDTLPFLEEALGVKCKVTFRTTGTESVGNS